MIFVDHFFLYFQFMIKILFSSSQCFIIGNFHCNLYREIFCPIVGCGAHLKSLDDFEDHYNSRHTASCSVCPRVYPTSRLLSLHVSETHDSFFQAKVARGYDMVYIFKLVILYIFLLCISISSYLLIYM